MSITVVVFASAMAVATFIENDYGTPTAKALIYNTKWFELLMFIMMINFIGNVFKYKLLRVKKWSVLLFHVAFIVALIGAFITRYHGFEGIMPIREGKVTNIMYSDKAYIHVRVDDNEHMKEYEKEVLFGRLGNNSYNLSEKFGKMEPRIPFEIELVNYVANAREVFVHDENGSPYIHIVESSSGSRNDVYLKEGEIKDINKVLFTYNNPIDGGINFTNTSGKMQLQSFIEGSVMEMKSQEWSPVVKDSVSDLFFNRLYSFKYTNFVIKEIIKGKLTEESVLISQATNYPYDIVKLRIKSEDQEQEVSLKGATGASPKVKKVSLNGLNFHLFYGSKEIQIPFSIKLRDFEMQRYPGTNSASSYASEITVMDADKTFDFRIFMNHVLDYKGYRFFQASFDKDEKGTVLSVNHDYWGTLITYLGYILMGIGMFSSLFLKASRFKAISAKINKLFNKKNAILFLLLSVSLSNFAQELPDNIKGKVVSKEHADQFGKLLIQDHQGRIKPINTYALEALRKIYKKSDFKGLTAEQVLLSAQLFPKQWSEENIVKVNTVSLGSKMSSDLKVKDKYTSMMNFFVGGHYYLDEKVSESFRKKNSSKNATDKEIINLDERANIWWNLIKGNLTLIYPLKGDPNNKWYTSKEMATKDSLISKFHAVYMSTLMEAVSSNDYSIADQRLSELSTYQKNIGATVIPPKSKIDLEIKYNRWDIFKRLLFYYMILGFVFLTLTFINLFKPKSKIIKLLINGVTALTIIGMLVHAIGMGVRWYVSGHEPWSNGYEAVVFVSFMSIVAGLIFSFKRSKFVLAATVLFASFLLGIAHGSMMSPEMTNLVPVLKSYWLMIHVAVITGSYAFLGLGSLLGFIVLLLYIIRNKKNDSLLNNTIKELTYINESALTVGLYMLTIGTFLGGVWANESWGRYWSWDPKEVWSLISMMVYIFVLHMRIVPGLKSGFAFNVTSLFAIATLIMTFFGVNFYLSGMHSYAAGDPVPIPFWIYPSIVSFIVFSIVAYWRYAKYKE
jgi:cytochrome c-type biogenesis protein CcsB